MLIDDDLGMTDLHPQDHLWTGEAHFHPDHQCPHHLIDVVVIRLLMTAHLVRAEGPADTVQEGPHLLHPLPKTPWFSSLRKSIKNNDQFSFRRLHRG
jgi:hypothetical protein